MSVPLFYLHAPDSKEVSLCTFIFDEQNRMELFEQLGISEKFIKGIDKLGFTAPTKIQEEAIPQLLQGDRDLIGLAQTGTGKTAAFGLPMLQLIDPGLRKPQGLILSPTRELCVQIKEDLETFSFFEKDIRFVAIYGGAGIEGQLSTIKKGVHIVVATPGRMVDILKRKAIDFSNIRYAVLDEADEMLNMGFKDDLDFILSNTPDSKKTWLFSATMPREVKKIASNYMDNAVEVTAGPVNSANVNIEHEYYLVSPRNKYPALKRIIDFVPDIYSIVFTKTKREAQEIAENLIKSGVSADSLHGDLSQVQREKTLSRFKNKSLQVLVATDVAARGIDVDDITHVINYSLPDDPESYTHRSGRTARAGKKGTSLSLLSSGDMYKLKNVERILKKSFVKCEVPSGFDVCEKQLFDLIHRARNVAVDEEKINPYIDRILQEFGDLDREEIIKRFVSLEFNRFLEAYGNAPDLNQKHSDRRDSSSSFEHSGGRRQGSERRQYSSERGFARVFVNIGFEDGLNRGEIFRLIAHNTSLGSKQIGRIDVKSVFSFVEVQESIADAFIKEFRNFEINGRDVRAEHSKGGGGGGRSRGNRSHRR